MVSGRQNGPGFVTLYAQGAKCRPVRTYFTPKILRSSPRRHLGERTTTIPMKPPPLPHELTVSGYSSIWSVQGA